jgi:ribonuclease P protein component
VFLFESHRAGALPRLGITASRRVGNAVVRNRAKRLVREAFRATRELWPTGADIVVIVRGALTTMKLNDVVREWEAARGSLTARLDRVLSSPSEPALPLRAASEPNTEEGR